MRILLNENFVYHFSTNYSWFINLYANLLFNKKKKLELQLKEGKKVIEKEKIRVYLDNINEKFRAKQR